MPSDLKKIILIIGDIAILYLSLYLTLILRYNQDSDANIWQSHFWPFTLVYIFWVFIFYLAGLYSESLAKNDYTFYSVLIKAVSISAGAAIAIFYLVPFFAIAPKTNLALNIFIFLTFFTLWRRIYNSIIKSSALLNNIIFIGENKEVMELVKLFKQNPQLGYNIVGVITDTNADIKKIVLEKNAKTVVHARDFAKANLVEALYSLIPLGITVYDLAKFYANTTKKIPVSIIGETWFLENLMESEKNIYEMTKRATDILLSIILGIFAILISPFIVLTISLGSKGGAFYTQKRIGKNGSIFNLIKFRTMIQNAEKTGAQWTKDNDKRVTKIGGFLRKMRIDELPQLINVLKGDMSFVGPRPERPEFIKDLASKIPHYQMRHLTRPGLTGWAQIHQPLGGASIEDSTEKLQYDLFYIKNRSLALDMDIIFKTIMVVLRREGH